MNVKCKHQSTWKSVFVGIAFILLLSSILLMTLNTAIGVLLFFLGTIFSVSGILFFACYPTNVDANDTTVHIKCLDFQKNISYNEIKTVVLTIENKLRSTRYSEPEYVEHLCITLNTDETIDLFNSLDLDSNTILQNPDQVKTKLQSGELSNLMDFINQKRGYQVHQ